jgi:predicted glycogen debranching enzyme
MKTQIMNFNKETLSDFGKAIRKEWIITNGLGGYASSTILGINTRKYHGLLIGALRPPGDRRVCLSKLDEEVSIQNNTYPLGANEFQTGIFPKGYDLLQEFSLSPFPKYVYAVQNVVVHKTIFMPHEKNVTITLYRILNKNDFDVGIRVFPLMNWRPFHSVTNRWKTSPGLIQKQESRAFEIQVDAPQSTLVMAITDGRFYSTEKWVERVYFREEAARGESCLDDCYQPGYFETFVKAKRDESFAITTVADKDENVAREIMNEMPLTVYDVKALYENEASRHDRFLTGFYEENKHVAVYDWLSWLISASNAFIVRGSSADQLSVIAGYYWFEAWGRDTFVSLPGLMLTTGRFEDARRVLLSFNKHCKQGLIPNFISEFESEPVYNSVDATLWFVNAVWQYLKHTGDFKFVREQLWETLKAIVENQVRGTMFGIHVDFDGLLAHGERLTWMDAMVDGQPVTPRSGKAVEVQALWYNALRIAELLANRFNEIGEAEKCGLLADRMKKSFVEKFWNAERNCLFDVISWNERDGSLRPNQVLVVALDFMMLDAVKSEGVVDVVQRELLTPFGLRTLAKSDPRYVGVYAGDRGSRDRAYHNGTIWPWLLGPFTTAYLKVKGSSEFRREFVFKNFLFPLLTGQVFEAGLGFLSEVFDGDAPHLPRGCVAQAWSVAELLRAYVEEVVPVRPKYEREVLQKLV